MALPQTLSETEVKELIKEWWSRLQFERKCVFTNTVSKAVNQFSEQFQEEIRQFISDEIRLTIKNCCSSKDLTAIQNACNAINGCFDNFTQAIDAVKYALLDVISFIIIGVNECHSKLSEKCSTKNYSVIILELLHSISRILILILKLKKTKKNEIETEGKICEDLDDENKKKLSELTITLGSFLLMDEVLIDTKNNLAMAGILIREIVIKDVGELKKYHTQFLATIPSKLENESNKILLIKFLISSAIINTWSTEIIDEDATYVYLLFFINLCENYSSDTSIILNSSRTLLLLIKHNCFKEFILKNNVEKVYSAINSLLSCVYMILEHPVACVRNSAKDFIQLLASYSTLQFLLIDSTLKLPEDKRSYYICVAALAAELGSRVLIEKNEKLPQQLLNTIKDPTIVSHVALALESVMLKDSVVEKNFAEWCETWIVPLLLSLNNVLPIVAAEIDKILDKAFMKHPNTIVYIMEKWMKPATEEELRCMLTALKINHKQSAKIKGRNIAGVSKLSNSSLHAAESNANKKWNKSINQKLMKHCLHHGDDDIRISAFSLLIEEARNTTFYTEDDFNLLKYFLKYNMNNHQPATRQKFISLIRKMLIRFSDSRASIEKKKLSISEKKNYYSLYDDFKTFLKEFCFSNIFAGCNFNRLNIVLNILLLCFEHIKDFNFEPDLIHWNKLLTALNNSYEENKLMAVDLSRKLNFLSVLEAERRKGSCIAKSLFVKAFHLINHMEPPDVLTGSYSLQILVNLPQSEKIFLKHMLKDKHALEGSFGNAYHIKILTSKLKEQLRLAKLDLMTAATCGPMYGTLFAIRLLFKNISFINDSGEVIKVEEDFTVWAELLNDLVEICVEITHVVESVVNSSSPEGHLPMDFQTNFENLTLQASNKDLETSSLATENRTINLSKMVFKDSLSKLKDIKSRCGFEDSDGDNFKNNDNVNYESLKNTLRFEGNDNYETVRDLNCLLKISSLLISKLNNCQKTPETSCFMDEVIIVKDDIENLLKNFVSVPIIDWPATAQVLLLCAWRSIKEACLYLGDFVSKLPIEKSIELKILSESTIFRIGEELKNLLCEIKHRGAFEHVYIAFTQLVNSLWKCSDTSLSNLPKKWLEEIINHLELPMKDQKIKLCSTRRSAGLPFLVQAIICSEIVSVKSATPSSLHTVMKSMFQIIENGVAENSDSKIHALNILRALFKHTQLGEHVAPYISKALMVAIRGCRASTWSERNSSSLLFSSLITRIFGVARSRDEISKKNRMTSRTFFKRYNELYDFLLAEMDLAYSTDDFEGVHPKPSLYLALLILGRLYPPPTEDPETTDVSKFLPYINMSRENPVMKIRELGARALVPLISLDRLVLELNDRFSTLSLPRKCSQNEMHGILLQIKALLVESADVLENFSKDDDCSWIEDSKWMLEPDSNEIYKISFVITASYIKVLHILFKHYPRLRNKIAEIISNCFHMETLNMLNKTEQMINTGLCLCLENFYFLKIDVLSHLYFESNEDSMSNKFWKVFIEMLTSPTTEVQSIPLRILCFILQNNVELNIAEDDFAGIAAPVSDLLVFKTSENSKKLQDMIFKNSDILKIFIKIFNESQEENSEYFKSKAIHCLWLTASSSLLLQNIISIQHDHIIQPSIKIQFAKELLDSTDKEISPHALICYSIYLLEEIELKKNEGNNAENVSSLFTYLNEFSDPDADVKERLAAAKVLNYSFDGLFKRNLITDSALIKLLTIPLKLLVDEDENVRMMMLKFVHKMQSHISHCLPEEKQKIEMETLDWPDTPLVSLKAQEILIDSYINILEDINYLHLSISMIKLGLSYKNSDADTAGEFGVFERGNPNPYCENLAFINLICWKVKEIDRIYVKGIKDTNEIRDLYNLYEDLYDQLVCLQKTLIESF